MFLIFKRLYQVFCVFGFDKAILDLKQVLLIKLLNKRQYFIYHLKYSDYNRVGTTSENFKIQIELPSELISFCAFPVYELSKEFLNSSSEAKAVTLRNPVDNNLLGYGFFTEKQADIEAGIPYKPEAGNVYLFKFFILEEYRNKGLLRQLINTIYDSLKDKNIKKLIVIILINNFTSQIAFEKIGFRKVGILGTSKKSFPLSVLSSLRPSRPLR